MRELRSFRTVAAAIAVVVAGAMASGSTVALADEVRSWKSRDGKYEVNAALVAANDDAVKLRRSDGEVVNVPLAQLRNEDREFVRLWKADRKATPVPGIIPDVYGESVDLLALMDPAKDVVKGGPMKLENGVLMLPRGRTVTQIPNQLPPQYQVRAVVTRDGDKTTAFSIATKLGSHQGLVVIDSVYGKRSGLVWIDTRNEPNNETYYRSGVLTAGKAHEIVCTIYHSRVHVSCDGKTIMDWCGDPSRLTLDKRWWSGVPADKLMVSASGAAIKISELELRPIVKSEFDAYKITGKRPDAAEAVALIEHPAAKGTGYFTVTTGNVVAFKLLAHTSSAI